MASRALETLSRLTALVVGFVAMPTPAVRDDHGARDDERGLSQSTENAVLLAGAVVVAGIAIAAVRSYVESNMPK